MLEFKFADSCWKVLVAPPQNRFRCDFASSRMLQLLSFRLISCYQLIAVTQTSHNVNKTNPYLVVISQFIFHFSHILTEYNNTFGCSSLFARGPVTVIDKRDNWQWTVFMKCLGYWVHFWFCFGFWWTLDYLWFNQRMIYVLEVTEDY